jgi:hypothetical protein
MSQILVVDDEMGIRELLSEILGEEGLPGEARRKRGRGAHAAQPCPTRSRPARHLDARHRRHHPSEGVGQHGSAHHAGGDDVRARHHRHRGGGHAHRRVRFPREAHRPSEAALHGRPGAAPDAGRPVAATTVPRIPGQGCGRHRDAPTGRGLEDAETAPAHRRRAGSGQAHLCALLAPGKHAVGGARGLPSPRRPVRRPFQGSRGRNLVHPRNRRSDAPAATQPAGVDAFVRARAYPPDRLHRPFPAAVGERRRLRLAFVRRHRADAASRLRDLAMDAVQKANSGHPGMPMGMAEIAEVLWNDSCGTIRPIRPGPTATVSCCPTATAPCCSTPCCT